MCCTKPMTAAIVALAILAGAVFPAPPARADGPALVTVTGAPVTSNRPGFDPFADAFLAFSDKSFEHAHAFDFEALSALPQIDMTAAAQGWPRTVAARGPLLADVLARAGVGEDRSVTLVALDGYAVTLDATERRQHDWVLAIKAEGLPLGLGGRGPAWLLRETGQAPVEAEAEAQWVWSVYLITVE